MKKKIIGILIVSVLIISLLSINILLLNDIEDLNAELLYAQENGSPALTEAIENLTTENINLQKQLQENITSNAENAIDIAEIFLETYWKNSNTQLSETLSNISYYCTDDVVNYLDYGCDGTYTNYGDVKYESGVKKITSYYFIENDIVTVLCDTEIFISIDGYSSESRYLYELNLEYIDNKYIVTEILQDLPIKTIG